MKEVNLIRHERSPVIFIDQIGKARELSLSANQERSEMERKRLVWQVESMEREESKVLRGGPVDPAKMVVEITPMEIRTFILQFDQHK